jgi:hypothetical protein
LSDRKDALTRGTKNLRIDGLKLHDKHQEHLLCVKHWFKELDDPQAAAGPSQAFADTPIGQSLLKLDESQRKRLESLFNTAYGVVKAGKIFLDYELICEIQVKNGLDLGENYRNINGCKTFAASIAQTLVDKQVKFKNFILQIGLAQKLFQPLPEIHCQPWLCLCQSSQIYLIYIHKVISEEITIYTITAA